ncbi:(2E,6E)-farnesyl diphosphate synthase [Pseudoalteromonas tunicata]|uniref:Geranyltranstransferase (Farnesyldiphosphate synthase or FPP synthase) n=1 Tax=Pseudoalteromonas tunicata D2 TaxID=87626 RepID=A4C9G0_9GAMM|nr:geranyltranstransferase (farnesyldiphosphate synthase or FPP synthase) [Pseudoalteromonas tunicata D2]
MTIKKLIVENQLRVEGVLDTLLTQPMITDQTLLAASRYSLLNGGKRMRPCMVYVTGEIFGANPDDLDLVAAAIECIHSYSLVHDDLPAMDDDDLRRGMPTCHIAYDEATAILAGDALQTFAFEILSSSKFKTINAQQQVALIANLASASGLRGMCGGQALDIAATNCAINLTQLEQIHQLKTGALLTSAILMGAICAPKTTPEILQNLKIFGENIGLAFQVQDDILDIEGDTAVLGKPQGSDLQANKSTYPSLLGLEQAKLKSQQLYENALNALAQIPADTTQLAQLAAYIVSRDH